MSFLNSLQSLVGTKAAAAAAAAALAAGGTATVADSSADDRATEALTEAAGDETDDDETSDDGSDLATNDDPDSTVAEVPTEDAVQATEDGTTEDEEGVEEGEGELDDVVATDGERSETATAVHEALTGGEATPEDGAAFGSAVSDRAREDGRSHGEAVSSAARGDVAAPDEGSGDEVTDAEDDLDGDTGTDAGADPASEDIRVEGQERADDARQERPGAARVAGRG